MSTHIFTSFLFVLLYFNSFGQKPIFEIARSGSLQEVKEIYEKYPDSINSINDAGYTPLIIACYSQNNEVATFIANHSKNINQNSGYGTALMASVVKGNKEMVQKLCMLGADPNIADSNKTTALHYAVMFQNEPIVKLLIQNKADQSLEDHNGFSPSEYALKTKNTNLINLLKL